MPPLPTPLFLPQRAPLTDYLYRRRTGLLGVVRTPLDYYFKRVVSLTQPESRV